MLVGAQIIELFLVVVKLAIAGWIIRSFYLIGFAEMEAIERRRRLLRSLCYFTLFALLLSYESSYRPKIQGAHGQSRIDIQPIAPLQLPDAASDEEDNANEGYSKQNIQENRDTVEAFRNLK